MKLVSSIFVALLLVPALASAEEPAKPDGKAKPAAAAPDMNKMMQEMQKWAAPGEPHKMLAKSAGKWNVSTKMVMGPGAPAMESKGTAEITPILGGRFMRQDFTGDMGGMAFHGMGLSGYDNFKKQYSSLWMDDMGTGMMTSYGTAAADGKSVTFIGTMDEPMTGEKNKKIKQVMRWVDDNTFVFEMYDKAKGKEWKVMEITYTRAK